MYDSRPRTRSSPRNASLGTRSSTAASALGMSMSLGCMILVLGRVHLLGTHPSGHACLQPRLPLERVCPRDALVLVSVRPRNASLRTRSSTAMSTLGTSMSWGCNTSSGCTHSWVRQSSERVHPRDALVIGMIMSLQRLCPWD